MHACYVTAGQKAKTSGYLTEVPIPNCTLMAPGKKELRRTMYGEATMAGYVFNEMAGRQPKSDSLRFCCATGTESILLLG